MFYYHRHLKGNDVRLVEVIEELSLDNDSSDHVINNIIRLYDEPALIELGNQFLTGIARQPAVPGRVVATLWGICQYYYEHRQLSIKQKFYLLGNVIAHWHQLGPETRAQLML